MANKKISELDSRASLSLSDLLAVGDPTTGYLYKITITDLKSLTGAGVISFNGRVGSVAPAEGDYTLNQLGDVIITSATNGNILQYNGSNWVNVAAADLSGFVPYTGATSNVNLGTYDLSTDIVNANDIKALTSGGLDIYSNSGTHIALMGGGGGAGTTFYGGLIGTTGSFSSSGGSNTFSIDHSSGSGIALSITKGGNGEGIYVNKTSGSGNAATIVGTLNATTLVKSGGTSSQFLKADGSVDSSTYLTTSSASSTYVPLTRTLTINGTAFDLSADRTWTIPTHDAVTIGTANGLSLSGQALSLALASTSATGALSSTDWNTFNGKQNALTNPVTGTGTSGHITYFTGSTSVAGSANHFWDATNNRLGIGTTTPQRSLEIFNATADAHLRLSGAAPTVSMGEAVTGSVYQAKFGLVTANAQFVTGSLAGDFVIISQTGATIWVTSGGEKMRLTSGGNVGINTTAPSEILDVRNSYREPTSGEFTQLLSSTTTQDAGRGGSLGFGGFFSGTSSFTSFSGIKGFKENGDGGNTAGALAFFTRTNGGAISERMRISSTGAATFSSSVTASSFTLSQSGASGSTTWNIYRDQYAGGDFSIWAGSTTRLLINASGNLGLGTTAPTSPLHIGNTTSGNQKIQQWGEPGFVDNYGLILRGSSLDGVFKFYGLNNGTETTSPILSMARSSGNVGMGTTAPTNYSGYTTLSINNATNGGLIDLQYNGTSQFRISGEATQNAVFGASNIPLVFSTNSIERMRITSGGNVGIGTTSPNSVLEVYGQTRISASLGSVLLITPDATSTNGVTLDTSYYGSAGYGPMKINVGGSERMRITSGGQVQIKQASNTFGDGFRLINSSNAYWGLVVGGDNNLYLGYNSPSASIGVFNSSTGAYTATSDINKKKDFEDSTIGLNAILGLKPTLYRMKGEENSQKHLGFIAQEVKDYIPQAYSENINGDNTFIGLTEMPIIAALVKAIQEQQTQIEQLKNK
jgi:hypothetical protein